MTQMANTFSTDDLELMQRIQQRDQSALVDLHGRYYNLVYNMAMQVLKNPSRAEEVTQDVFFQIWRWPEKWDAQKGRFTSWLLTVTRYTAIDRLRRENRQLLRSLMKELPQEQREMILLVYFRGMTHTEVAENLKLPVGTVKSRLRLGLQKLKDAWFEAMEQPSAERE